jgi:hypothetical protein
MIFYSWTALSESDLVALSESDLVALSESDLVALSESDSVALGDSRPAAPGDGGWDARGGRDVLGDGDLGSAGSPVAMGITDDRGRAMKAAEETLGSGLAVMVIIEAVRPAMAGHTLTPCYVRTGVAWLGRYTDSGEVAWKRFFL